MIDVQPVTCGTAAQLVAVGYELIEADPTLIGIVVAILVVAAVLYVVFAMRKTRYKR